MSAGKATAMAMLPECKACFQAGERRMDELHDKMDALDKHMRNGVTSKIATQGAMITVMWPVLLLVLGGLVGLAYKTLGSIAP